MFTYDYFIKNTDDLLVEVPVPYMAGLIVNPTLNAGSVQNKGWEFSLSWRNFERKLKYEISGNISRVRNEVISLGEGGAPIVSGVNRTEVGHPISSFYGFVTDGIFQNWDEVNSHAKQNTKTSPGDIRFKDLNDDGIINDLDQTFIGSPLPDYLYGLNTSISYGGFDLVVFIQGQSGNEIYNEMGRNLSFAGRDNMSEVMLDRWTGEGTSTTVPRLTAADVNNNTRVSDRYIEDGSYLRIKNAQLGYSLPSGLTKKINIEKFRIYLAGQNLYTFTKYSGFDPDLSSDNRYYGTDQLVLGVDRGNYPSSRMIMVGVQIGF